MSLVSCIITTCALCALFEPGVWIAEKVTDAVDARRTRTYKGGDR